MAGVPLQMEAFTLLLRGLFNATQTPGLEGPRYTVLRAADYQVPPFLTSSAHALNVVPSKVAPSRSCLQGCALTNFQLHAPSQPRRSFSDGGSLTRARCSLYHGKTIFLGVEGFFISPWPYLQMSSLRRRRSFTGHLIYTLMLVRPAA